MNRIYGNMAVVLYVTSNLGQHTSNWSWVNFNSIGSKKKLKHKWRLCNSKQSVGSVKDSFEEECPKNKDATAKKNRTKNVRNADKKSKEELASAKEHTSSECIGPIEEQQAFVQEPDQNLSNEYLSNENEYIEVSCEFVYKQAMEFLKTGETQEGQRV